MSLEITPTGIDISDTAEILAAVQEDWKEIFGPELNLDPETPQGQIIASLVAIIADKEAQILRFCHQINPETAEGVMQDAIGSIYFITRTGALPTYVQLECKGLPGTYIPGFGDKDGPAMAKSENGDLFGCSVGGTIPASATISLQFESMEIGPIPAPAGTVNQIYKSFANWDSCTNPQDGVVGRDAESRADFEFRRRQSVAKNATGSVNAIFANVANLDGVVDCKVYENTSWNIKKIGSVEIEPKSVYVSVEGGKDNDIAQAIYSRKSASAGTTGNTAMTIYDKASGAEYEVKFQRPTKVNIKVQITALRSTAPVNAEVLIKQAVEDNFLGKNNAGKVGIGDTLYASRFYSALDQISVNATNILVAINNGTFSTSVSCEINQFPVLNQSDITVTLQ